jgi:hypothetical protein
MMIFDITAVGMLSAIPNSPIIPKLILMTKGRVLGPGHHG